MSETIYVRLMNEDIDVWRPVLAKRDGRNNSFMILPKPFNLIPDGEQWEFAPGDQVMVKEMVLDGEIVKVASKGTSDT